MTKTIIRIAVCGLLLLGSFSGIVSAQEIEDVSEAPVEEPKEQGWEYALAPFYLWAVGMQGVVGAGPIEAGVDVQFKDALDNLEAAFAVHYEMKKNKNTFIGDIYFASLGSESDVSLPNLPVAVNIDATVDQTIIEGAWARQVRPGLELIVGARWYDLSSDVSVAGPGGGQQQLADGSESWADGFIGLRGIANISRNWIFRSRFDIGAGGSDLVFNGNLMLDWRFSDLMSVLFGYRWMDIDYEDGEGPDRFRFDMRQEGAVVALVFHWGGGGVVVP